MADVSTRVFPGMGKGKATRRKVDHLEIHRADGGGHIVVHHYHQHSHGLDGAAGFSPYEYEPTSHVFGEDKGSELLAHVAKHMRVHAEQEPTEAEEEGVEEHGERE